MPAVQAFAAAARPSGRPARCPAPTPAVRFPAHHGGDFVVADLAWELHGPDGAPIVVVLGGISASRHVASHAAAPADGWWEPFVGAGKAIDTTRVRVLGVDWHTRDDGAVDTRDQARCLALVLDRIGAASVHAIVGSSYGGMVALAFAALFPSRVGRLVVISAAHEPHPMATALRTVQRGILRLGRAAGREADGVALARALGITTYRTADEFAERFDTAPVAGPGGFRFPVQDYLDHGGTTFAARFDAARYTALSESLDLHRVDPAAIRTPTTLLAVESDTLVPAWQMRQLFAALDAPGRYHEIASLYGHDAFLKEVDAVSEILTSALTAGVSHVA